MRERVKNMFSGTLKVVVNLDKEDHVDSGGIGILVRLFVSARNRGRELKLVSPNKHVSDVLRRTNLDTVFRVYRK